MQHMGLNLGPLCWEFWLSHWTTGEVPDDMLLCRWRDWGIETLGDLSKIVKLEVEPQSVNWSAQSPKPVFSTLAPNAAQTDMARPWDSELHTCLHSGAEGWLDGQALTKLLYCPLRGGDGLLYTVGSQWTQHFLQNVALSNCKMDVYHDWRTTILEKWLYEGRCVACTGFRIFPFRSFLHHPPNTPASLVWLWKGKRRPSPKRRFRSLRIWKSFPRVSSTVSVLPFPQRQLVGGLRLHVFGVVGGIDLQGCGCDFHRGGAGAAGLGPEEAVPRRDAGELPEPAVRGWGWHPVTWHHPRRVPWVSTPDF